MSHKVKRKLKTNDFLDDEAVEDNSESSEDVYIGEKERRELEEQKRRFDKLQEDREKHTKKITEDNIHDIVNDLENRNYDDEEEMEEYYEPKIPERDELKDYPIYEIHCRQGKEKEIAMSIMKHWIAQKDKIMNIFSVFVPEEKSGIIYVESLDESSFIDAVENVRNIYVNTIRKVRYENVENNGQFYQSEYEQLFLTRIPSERELINSYVRIKSGLYKDDLGIIVDLRDRKAIVKLVPRFDVQYVQNVCDEIRRRNALKRNNNDDDDEDEKSSRRRMKFTQDNITKQRFIPSRLNIKDIVKDDKDDSFQGTVWKFGNQRYYNGYIHKAFNLNQLKYDQYPTPEEKHEFLEDLELLEEGKMRQEDEERKVYTIGSKVRIIKEIEGFYGKVSRIYLLDGDYVRVEGIDLKEKIKLKEEDFEVHYDVNDRVKVTNGTYNGETGIIERFDGNDVYLFADTSHTTICVAKMDIIATEEIQNKKNELNGYFVNDFIQLSDGVGLILDINFTRKKIIILNDKNERQEIDPSQIQSKYNERKDEKCKDRNRNVVIRGEVVEIIGGAYKGRSARVNHIYQFSRLFCICPGIIENSSNIVISNKDIKKINSTHKSLTSNVIKPNYQFREDYNSRNSKQNERDNDYKRGMKVNVRKGPYKNYKGKIVNILGEEYTIELEANMKKIKLDIDSFEPIGSTNRLMPGTPKQQGDHFGTPLTPTTHAATPKYGPMSSPYNYVGTPAYGGMGGYPPKTPHN